MDVSVSTQAGPPAEACASCGLAAGPADGPVHPYMTSSPGCWAAFGRLLAADYADPARMGFHQVVVDSYAAQHPGEGGRRQVQSVGLHLMTLCLFLEHDVDPALGRSLHKKMIRRLVFSPVRPSASAPLTVVHVPAGGPAARAREAAYEWASAVWSSYAADHDTVRAWLREAGFDVPVRTPRAAARSLRGKGQ